MAANGGIGDAKRQHVHRAAAAELQAASAISPKETSRDHLTSFRKGRRAAISGCCCHRCVVAQTPICSFLRKC